MSVKDVSDSEGEEDVWDEDWGEVEGEECVSLFSDFVVLPSVQACCEYDARHHEFDLREYIRTFALDDYGVIKCINFIRRAVADGTDPLPQVQAGPDAFKDDQYLQPVRGDDALLFHDFSQDEETKNEAAVSAHAEQELEQLRADNEALRQALQQLRVDTLPEELRESRDEATTRTGEASTSTTTHRAAVPAVNQAVAGASARSKDRADVDEAYFDSYSFFDIHREMLEDKTRTGSYRQALENNPTLMKGATILDVGCGTGILSLFAARAGAKQVIAIDAAPRIVEFAAKNCIANGYSSSTGGPIHVIAGKAEELTELPCAERSADVLVSEWMGYALLFESMLESVLLCRDRWLKPGGAILPDKAVIYVAAGDSSATGLDFWDHVYGFDFPDIKAASRSSTLAQPLVAPVASSALLGAAAAVKAFDLTSMSVEDVDFSSDFNLAFDRDGECHALVLWFDTPVLRAFLFRRIHRVEHFSV